jgi:hypothetical protein
MHIGNIENVSELEREKARGPKDRVEEMCKAQPGN